MRPRDPHFDGTDCYDKHAYGSLWAHLEGAIGRHPENRVKMFYKDMKAVAALVRMYANASNTPSRKQILKIRRAM